MNTYAVTKKRYLRNIIAGAGFEPCDLQVMGLVS